MKSTIYLLFILSFTSISYTQTLPDAYLGNYKGELKMYNTVEFNTIDMELEITKTDTIGVYNYIIRYLVLPNPDIRNYKLIALDSTTGQYTLDENNGIKIPTTYVNHTLQSFFQVQTTLLSTKVCFENNRALYEISMSNTKLTDTTQTYDGQFKVLGYPVNSYHKAILEKE